VLLRRVIGDALRARRQGQHRTLREISTAANVSLGYLSEIERGQKEASSELLAAICEALGSQMSEVLREASDSLAQAERTGVANEGELVEAGATSTAGEVPQARPASEAGLSGAEPQAVTEGQVVTDGQVSVSVRRDGPLRTTLHAVRARPSAPVARS
jgi:transcriptional regulator with XRE-family HTH domain